MADSNILPLTLRMSALPLNFQGTPQELADAIAEGLEILSQQQFALFQKGSAEPFSDVGPWMDTSSTIGIWKAFNVITGRYEPMVLDQISLKYILSAIAPDPDDYLLWVRLNGGGQAEGISSYFAGAWHDVYELALASINTAVAGVNTALAAYSTTVAMNAAIDAAIAAIPPPTPGGGAGVFRAEGADQAIGAAGSVVVTLGTEGFDPDNCFAANKFTAPSDGYYHFDAFTHSELTSATPAEFTVTATVRRNGGGNTPGANGVAMFGSNIIPITCNMQLNLGDTVDLIFEWSSGVGSTATFKIGGMLSGFKIR